MTKDGERIPKSEKTRRQIMQSYASLLKVKSFDKIYVSDIAQELDISRTTFYAYFDDSYSVIEKMENSILSNMPGPSADEFVLSSSRISVFELEDKDLDMPWYDKWLDYICEKRELFALLIGPNGNPQFPHKLRDHVRKLWRKQLMGDRFRGEPADQDFFLRVISDAQVRFIKDVVKKSAEDEYLKDRYRFLMRVFRTGAYVDRERKRKKQSPI